MKWRIDRIMGMRRVVIWCWAVCILFVLSMLVGCSSVSKPRRSTQTLYNRRVVLSFSHAQDDLLKARLVAIADDGTTTIEVIPTGGVLRASVGEYFVSEEYGTHG